jgi:hypothetical protein
VTCWNSIVEIGFSNQQRSHATMKKDTVVELRRPETGRDLLTAMLQERAQQLIAGAVQAEFEDFLARFAEERTEGGHAAVVRNGFQPKREILAGIGSIGVRIPKARSRTEATAVFRSNLVPPYVRRTKSLDAALPWLYLHGISTGDMREALAALVGQDAAGLSPAVVARLKNQWAIHAQVVEESTTIRSTLPKGRFLWLTALLARSTSKRCLTKHYVILLGRFGDLSEPRHYK